MISFDLLLCLQAKIPKLYAVMINQKSFLSICCVPGVMLHNEVTK